MHRVFPKTVWLLVIALIAQLVSVAGTYAHMGGSVSQADLSADPAQSHNHSQPMSQSVSQSVDMMEHSGACAAMAKEVKEGDSGFAMNKSCDGKSSCHLQHCGVAHALAKEFPAPLFIDLNRAWPRFSPNTLLLPFPPPGQPPKTA